MHRPDLQVGNVFTPARAVPGAAYGGGQEDVNETGHFSDGEIHFNGEFTLDNGITVGAQVELESFSSGDQIDENYAYLEGSFGRVRLGSENSASYMMQYAAPNVGVPINSGWVTSFIPAVADASTSASFNGQAIGATPFNANSSFTTPGSTADFRHPSISTFVDWGNDENNVTYFTPRIAGFQVGATYTPTITGSGDGANFPTNALQETADDGDGNHGVSLGANYVQSFNGVDVALAGGYNVVTDENPAIYGDSPFMANAGINIGYGGFTVGGSWAHQDSENPAGNDFGNDGDSFDLGASYSTGPWSVGVTGFYSEVEGQASNSSEDELTSLQGGVEYALGPGVTTSFSVLYGEWEDETGVESDGILGITGLSLSF